MKNIRTIIAACDMSPYTPQVLDYAMATAKAFGAKIILSNVINKRDIEAIEYAIHKVLLVEKNASAENAVRQFVREREEALHALYDDLKAPNLIAKTMVKVGEPFRVLIDLVNTENADIIVMGTKGRSNLQETLLGGTAAKLFQHCPVPVLSVRLQK